MFDLVLKAVESVRERFKTTTDDFNEAMIRELSPIFSLACTAVSALTFYRFRVHYLDRAYSEMLPFSVVQLLLSNFTLLLMNTLDYHDGKNSC